jgi:hypothetical protein
MLQLEPWTLVGYFFAAMLAMSGIAYLIFPKGGRVPMQWGLTGRPTWYAPKGGAVLFVPIISLAVMSLAFIPLFSDSDRQKVAAALPGIALMFLVIHLLHLCLAQWHFNAKKS